MLIAPPSPSVWKQFQVWLLVGLQSFGGGTATLVLLRRAVVQEQAWLTDAEFTLEWSLCRIAPGINLVALAILIGRRLGGGRGILAALTGLLVPSVLITVLISAFFSQFQRLPAGQDVLRGLIPATVGLGLVNAQQMARSSIQVSRRMGFGQFLLGWVLLAGSSFAFAFFHLPVLLVLCAAGLIQALTSWRQSRRTEESTPRP